MSLAFIAVRHAILGHRLNQALMNAACDQKSYRHRSPPGGRTTREADDNARGNTCDESNSGSFIGRFHVQSSVDVNAGSVAHDLA